MLISNSKSPSLPFRIPLYLYRGIFYSPVNKQGKKIFPISPDIYWPKSKWKQLLNTISCKTRVWLSENWPSKQKLGRFISTYTGESIIPLYVYRGLIYTGESYCPICTLCNALALARTLQGSAFLISKVTYFTRNSKIWNTSTKNVWTIFRQIGLNLDFCSFYCWLRQELFTFPVQTCWRHPLFLFSLNPTWVQE